MHDVDILVLMTCRNRKSLTVRALTGLAEAATVARITWRGFLTDDGSTDGTGAAIQALALPVTVVPGNGDLYWARGMAAAYMAASASGLRARWVLLLNDDVDLDRSCLQDCLPLLHGADVVVGATRGPEGGITYGAYRRQRGVRLRFSRVWAADQALPADTFNANFVLLDGDLFRRLGGLDAAFQHNYADLDLGLRAAASGARLLAAPASVGICADDKDWAPWRHERSMTLLDRWRTLNSPKFRPAAERALFLHRHARPAPRATLLTALPALEVAGIHLMFTIKRWASRSKGKT